MKSECFKSTGSSDVWASHHSTVVAYWVFEHAQKYTPAVQGPTHSSPASFPITTSASKSGTALQVEEKSVSRANFDAFPIFQHTIYLKNMEL